MDPVFDFGLEVTRQLQAAYPQLEGFFQFISSLGLEEFYLGLMPLIYWCLDKQLGGTLVYVFLLGHWMNSTGKHTFRGPRPFWLDSAVGLSEEASYGVPSGHMESATMFYGFLALWLKKGWMTALALFMIVAMGLSRVYLGVHFVHDVLVGLLIGIFVLTGYLLWRRHQAAQFSRRILGQRLLIAALVPTGLALIYAIIRLIIGAPDTAVPWASFISEAEIEGIEGVGTAVGALLGLGLGLNLERSRVRFRVDGPVWKRVLRYLVGMAGTLALWMGPRMFLPTDPLWLAVILRIARYTLILLWLGYYGPLVFVRLRLADADPDPGIQMTM
ncbi:MAG: phosphatase PAP2 family protein [Chloroflexi bacterium]|nr:phosphatase PAP2 family protein [Chloroflexota bacterium]